MGVVSSRQHRLHQLSHHNDRRITGIVIHILQAYIHCILGSVVQNLQLVAEPPEGRFNQIKVNGTHLRSQNRIALIVHLLGKLAALIAIGLGLFPLCLLHVHRGNQAPDADPSRPQIADLVDFQDCIEFSGLLQQFADLIRGHRIQSASEGIELHHLQILSGAHKFRRTVESGMIGPLIQHAQLPSGASIQGQAVLGEHIKAIGSHHFGNTMVDLRIDMIGATRQNNSLSALFFHIGKKLRSLFPDVLFCPHLFGKGQMYRPFYLPFGNVPFFLADCRQALDQRLLPFEGEEGMNIAHIPCKHILQIVPDIFGVGNDHRAVVLVLGTGVLLVLIEHTGMENGFYPFVDQPLDLPVSKLGRITLRFGGNAIHTQLVNLPAGIGRKHHSEAQFSEECGPEGIVFIDIQNSRYADRSPGRILFLQRRIVKNSLLLVLKKVFALFASPSSDALFAPVAGDVFFPSGKGVHGQQTIVLAPSATGSAAGIFQFFNLLKGQHTGLLPFVPLLRNQGRTESTHQSADVRADHLRSCHLFQGS